MRIHQHPIIQDFNKGRRVTFEFDGRRLEGCEGEPIAMALRAAGVMTHRYTARFHEPRGIFCAIGRCTDCVMVVDGKPNIRTCVTPLRAGMKVETQHGLSAQKE
jgi:predicted molibdopterin-dependent oxidoreductase YjgC